MKFCKSVLLSSLIGFATFGEAVAMSSEHTLNSKGSMVSATPTEEVGDEEHEETQAECILWPGCIVLPSSQTPQN